MDTWMDAGIDRYQTDRQADVRVGVWVDLVIERCQSVRLAFPRLLTCSLTRFT